jgi:hypothetical protein
MCKKQRGPKAVPLLKNMLKSARFQKVPLQDKPTDGVAFISK